MLTHTERLQSGLPDHDRHLFAAYAFYYPQGDSIEFGTAGLTAAFESNEFDCTEIISFVCVTVIRTVFSDPNDDEAVSGTTVHELGHMTNTSPSAIKDCSDDQTHADACVMMDLTETGGVLEVYCSGIRHDYTNLFCSTCADNLKLFMTGSHKL